MPTTSQTYKDGGTPWVIRRTDATMGMPVSLLSSSQIGKFRFATVIGWIVHYYHLQRWCHSFLSGLALLVMVVGVVVGAVWENN